MLVEVHGAGFANKGAQLMLQTVVEKLTEKIPGCECCISAGIDRPPTQVGKLGLKFIWPSKILEARIGKFRPLFKFANGLSSMVSESKLAPYGMVKRSQVDAMIDISGFAFSDMWGAPLMRNFETLAGYYAKRASPVVMLPQMLGPFDKPETKKLFRSMTSICSLVYARDSKSFEIASQCAADPGKVRQAPDITLFGDNGNYSNGARKDVMLVPNMRVLDMGADWDEAKYIATLVAAGRQAINSGHGVQILVHETFGKDAKLAEKIRAQLELPESSIYASPEPVELKSRIASGLFLVGSRFHSLAGALSTATPVVAIGWAHKYGQLLADFGVQEFDIPSEKEAHRIPGLVERLLVDQKRIEIVEGLKTSKQAMVQINEQMWTDVINVITSKTS